MHLPEGGGGKYRGIRISKKSYPRELDRTPRHRDGKLDTSSGNTKVIIIIFDGTFKGFWTALIHPSVGDSSFSKLSNSFWEFGRSPLRGKH